MRTGRYRPRHAAANATPERSILRFAALATSLAFAAIGPRIAFQFYTIPSESMSPGLTPGDRVLVAGWTKGEAERGDVVVFSDEELWLAVPSKASSTYLTKRVIGTPGDRVECCNARGWITVNGKPVNESPYLPKGMDPSQIKFDVKVPEGKLWVMGDNRSFSSDSRSHQKRGGGFIPISSVKGRVVAISNPTSRAGLLLDRRAVFAGVEK